MKDEIFYLPVRLVSHNGGTGSHSYFAVQPVPRDPDAQPWPLFLSPDGLSLLYIHPSQLRTAPDEQVDTLEELIRQRHNARIAQELASDQEPSLLEQTHDILDKHRELDLAQPHETTPRILSTHEPSSET